MQPDKPYSDVPGTTIFDLEQARKANSTINCQRLTPIAALAGAFSSAPKRQSRVAVPAKARQH